MKNRFLASEIRELITGPERPLHEVILKMNSNSEKMVCVADEFGVLLGVLTDGDLRRHLATGGNLDTKVGSIMTKDPITLPVLSNSQEALSLMRHKRIDRIPAVNEGGRLCGLFTQQDILDEEQFDNWVILMAGGEGRRLRPLTAQTPKPMLPIAGRPIIERIIRLFTSLGYWKFFISVNYLKEQIIEHLGDGSSFNASIGFLIEDEPTGTAGSLSLLPERPNLPFFLMNGDILTNLNMTEFMRAHEAAGNILTIGARIHESRIEFGVLHTSGNKVVRCEEKPTENYLINGGVYIAEPRLIDWVGDHARFYNMTDLIDDLLKSGEQVGVYIIDNYWRDIGHKDDLRSAEKDYVNIFDD